MIFEVIFVLNILFELNGLIMVPKREKLFRRLKVKAGLCFWTFFRVKRWRRIVYGEVMLIWDSKLLILTISVLRKLLVRWFEIFSIQNIFILIPFMFIFIPLFYILTKVLLFSLIIKVLLSVEFSYDYLSKYFVLIILVLFGVRMLFLLEFVHFIWFW